MEHPLITGVDTLTVDELQSRIADLTKKFNIASRAGNAHLANQIRMALETFNTKYQERMREQWAKKSGPDFSDRIDVS
jgi:hypothetical protein